MAEHPLRSKRSRTEIVSGNEVPRRFVECGCQYHVASKQLKRGPIRGVTARAIRRSTPDKERRELLRN